MNILDERQLAFLAGVRRADKDGNGVLDVNEVQHVLKSLGVGQLALKPGEINAMIAAIDADEDGTVNYTELVDFLGVLNHLSASGGSRRTRSATGAMYPTTGSARKTERRAS